MKTKRIEQLKERAKIASTWRRRRGLTGKDQMQFAKAHGFITSQISRWERGESIPGTRMIRKMEAALLKEGV